MKALATRKRLSAATPLGLDVAVLRRVRGGSRHTVFGILILAVMLFPVYWMLNVSLQPGGSAVGTPWLPLDVSLDGYATALRDQGGNLMTSLIVALGSVVFSLLIAAPGAYALAHFKVPGARVVLLGILISQMIPGIVVANALYSAYNDLGLLNSIPGLILADSTAGIPFAMLILYTFMKSIPSSIVEAAWVDGAGPLRTFVSVVMPLSQDKV